ncbi:hypothetical protein L7F22_047907 [Adiantum nelumboides]|nr:hypothetical protein [Adiantum nelumboides]
MSFINILGDFKLAHIDILPIQALSMDFLFRIAILALGHFYPAYKYFKVIDCGKPKSEQLYMWCQYWIIIAVFTGCERIADTFISWLRANLHLHHFYFVLFL